MLDLRPSEPTQLPPHESPGGAGHDRVSLLGVDIDRVSLLEAIERIAGFVSERRPRTVATVNLDFLCQAQRATAFRQVLNDADLALADGMPLVWAAARSGRPLAERVAGLDLVEAICERGARTGWSIFLLGGAPGSAAAAASVWQERYAGLRIAGVYCPPFGSFDADEELRIRERIHAASPDVLLVALGAPRQDCWLHDNLSDLGVPVGVGVGCAFEVAAGMRRRAPRWMQRSGLEWLFRLLSEPGRLAGRYLLRDLPGLFLLMRDASRAGRAAANHRTAMTGRGVAGARR